MNHIQLDDVLTPDTAQQHGITLVRTHQRASGELNILYSQSTRFGPVFCVTSSHLVSTITKVERIAVYALLHS